jgi:O-antigen ligase
MAMIVAALLLFMAWFAAEHFPPWISWHTEIWAFAAVMCAGGHSLFSRRWRSYEVKLPATGWPLGVLGMVAAMQAARGQIAFAGDAWILLFYLALAITAMAVGYRISNAPVQLAQDGGSPPQVVAEFAFVVLLGGLCSVALALAQSLELWEQVGWIHRMPGPRRPGANIGQANQLATLLLFALASLVFLFESGRLRRAAAVAMAGMLLFGLAITESRTGVLSLLVMAVWWLAKRRGAGLRLRPAIAGLWLGFFGLCFWFWPDWLSAIRIDAGGSASVNLQAGTRLEVWPQLWQAVLQRPWLGWGLGNVPEALNAVADLYPRSENFTYAHSLVLDLAIGAGIPLTLLLAISTAVWLWRRLRQAMDLLSWYCLALALPFAVHCMLEFPFAYAYLLAPAMFAIGVLEAHLAPTRAVTVGRGPARAAWALAGVLMAWSVVEYVAVEEDFRVARFQVLNVGQSPTQYERPRLLLLTQMDALLEGARLVPQPGMDERRLAFSHDVAMRFPGPATQNRYAVSLALNGRAEESVRQLRVMRALYGEKTYADIKSRWIVLSQEKYPQLRKLQLP